MRKYEQALYMALLDDEKAILVKLENVYQSALRDINKRIKVLQADELMQNRVYRKEHQEALRDQVEVILERLHTQEYETIDEYLKESYTDGFLAVMYSLHKQGIPLILPIDQEQVVKSLMTNSAISEGLYKSLGADVKNLRKAISQEISRGLASNASYGEIVRNVANQVNIPKKRARTIVMTETHRIKEEAAQSARVQARKEGCNIVKEWDATLDHKTRPTHRRLDGQIREVDEPFEIDGKKAMQPGGFGRPEEDCNCRCISLTRAKWALGEKELEILKERAAFWGLDKTDSFEEFKRKYMNAIKE